MVTKYKFKQFSFGNFTGFIRDLISKYDMGDIRFAPFLKGDFYVDNKYTLEHMGDENAQNTFVNVWSNNLDKMKVVSFELFKKKGGLPKIEMTFNLDKNIISLNKAQEITAEKIEESLEKFFDIGQINRNTNIWWKYTHPIWWIWVAILLVFKYGLWRLLKLAWKHKWITAIILLIVVPIIVGLCINYLTYRFGWNK